ncbi:ATP-binding protein [Rhodanobacter sp. B04]|uniref:ATP-binding protein n=1 Tax=Rhodanobacter sp. B04 TaxID=1945860 RepID=UPI00143C44F8|nr:ATP-binding protein [Rhodanobacter sp. B04]
MLLETRLLVQANSGGGKSYTLRRILEQTAPLVQQLIIDPEGEFATLREKFDYIIAAPHDADAVATPQTAALLARRLLESGVSAVLDIYDLKAHERQQFVRRFLDALVNAPRKLWHPVMVVLDEAHIFCPQTGSAEAASAVIDIATRGRKRGLCLVAATQRLSKLHKDTAAELLNKLIGRTGLDVDVKRAADELGMVSREALTALRAMPAGSFFAFGPALHPEPTLVTVAAVSTSHPKAGQRLMQAPPPASAKVRASLAKLADLQKDADIEARTVEDLQTQVATLTRQLRGAERRAGAPSASGMTEVDVQCRVEAAVAATIVIPPEFKKAQRLIQQLADLVLPKTMLSGDIKLDARDLADLVKPTREIRTSPIASTVSGLRAGAVRILQELAARSPAGYSKPQVGALTKFSHKGGTFNTYLSDLRRAGYLVERSSLLFASEAGILSLGDKLPSKPTTHADVMAMWRGALRAGAFTMLETIVAAGSRGIARRDIAEAVGMTASGGTFNTYLSDLRRNGLMTDEGSHCRANDILFPERSNV